MDSNGIIWTIVAGVVGLLGVIGLLTLRLVIADRRRRARASFEHSRAELAARSPDRKPAQAEPPKDRPALGERHRLVEAKDSADKAYAQRVSVAEHEFNAKKNRADVHLRAAEMFLEHALEYGRGHRGAIRDPAHRLSAREHESDVDAPTSWMDDAGGDFVMDSRRTSAATAVSLATRLAESPERKRSQRIRDARERLADALLEHRFAVAAAEKLLAAAKAQDADVRSCVGALEAFDARCLLGLDPAACWIAPAIPGAPPDTP